MTMKNVIDAYGLCQHLLSLVGSKSEDGYSFDVVNYVDVEGNGNISGRIVGTVVIDDEKVTYYATLYSHKGSLYYGVCETTIDKTNINFSGWYVLHRLQIEPEGDD